MNIEDTLAPTSDQLDAVELVGQPRTFTIDRVTRYNTEQPLNIHFKEFDRPWRPSKGMRRVLAACWGTNAEKWAERKVRLFCDETVRFGPQIVGGIRIAALSHIDGPKKLPTLEGQGRGGSFTVQPLPDEPADTATDWHALIDAATSRDELTAIREQAKKAKVSNGKQIDGWLSARATALNATQDTDQCPVCGLAGPLHDEAAHAEAGA